MQEDDPAARARPRDEHECELLLKERCEDRSKKHGPLREAAAVVPRGNCTFAIRDVGRHQPNLGYRNTSTNSGIQEPTMKYQNHVFSHASTKCFSSGSARKNSSVRPIVSSTSLTMTNACATSTAHATDPYAFVSHRMCSAWHS